MNSETLARPELGDIVVGVDGSPSALTACSGAAAAPEDTRAPTTPTATVGFATRDAEP